MSLVCVGFFGEGNLGDEAILEGLLTRVPTHRPVYVTAGRHPLPSSLADRVQGLPRRGVAAWPAFLAGLRQADQVVFTGGLLQDWSVDGVAFYALRLLAASLAGRRPSLWGAGLGPLRSAAARAVATRVLRRAHPVWVRDQASADLFQRLTGRAAHLGCDWSWAIPDPDPDDTPLAGTEPSQQTSQTSSQEGPPRPLPPRPETTRASYLPGNSARPQPAAPRAPRREGPTDPGLWGVNLRPWRDTRYRETACQALKDRPPATLLGVAARQEDAALLAATFPGLKIATPVTFTDLMRIGRTLAGAWAMRYHVVLAWLRMGVPVVPLAYDNKVAALGEEAAAAPSAGPPNAPWCARPGFPATARQRLQAMGKAFRGFLA